MTDSCRINQNRKEMAMKSLFALTLFMAAMSHASASQTNTVELSVSDSHTRTMNFDLCEHNVKHVIVRITTNPTVDWSSSLHPTMGWATECNQVTQFENGHPQLRMSMIGYDGLCRLKIAFADGGVFHLNLSNNYAYNGGCKNGPQRVE